MSDQIKETTAEEPVEVYVALENKSLKINSKNGGYQFEDGQLRIVGAKAIKNFNALLDKMPGHAKAGFRRLNMDAAEALAREHMATMRAAAVQGGVHSMNASGEQKLAERNAQLAAQGVDLAKLNTANTDLMLTENAVQKAMSNTAPADPAAKPGLANLLNKGK